MSEANAIDTRVALVEVACVAITLCRGRAGAVRVPEVVPPVPRRTTQTEITAESWAHLDLVDKSEVFRLRFSFAIALRERYRKAGGRHGRGQQGLETLRFASHFCC